MISPTGSNGMMKDSLPRSASSVGSFLSSSIHQRSLSSTGPDQSNPSASKGLATTSLTASHQVEDVPSSRSIGTMTTKQIGFNSPGSASTKANAGSSSSLGNSPLEGGFISRITSGGRPLSQIGLEALTGRRFSSGSIIGEEGGASEVLKRVSKQ